MTIEITRHSPVGFYHFGEDFFQVAAHSSGAIDHGDLTLRFNLVLYHLHTHSIELLLKAFLLAHGVTEKELRGKYRHGLNELWARCIAFKLRPKKSKRTAMIVETLDELLRDQRLRYFESGSWRLHDLVEVRSANKRIPNPIIYSYLKDNSLHEERELRISLSAPGIGQFMLNDGTAMDLPVSLQMPFDFRAALSDGTIKEILRGPQCDVEFLIDELKKMQIEPCPESTALSI
jgi:hypothetical protein